MDKRKRSTADKLPKEAGQLRNGFIHTAPAGTAKEIRKALGIGRSDIRTILRVFKEAGVHV
jgi:hypothetical protein